MAPKEASKKVEDYQKKLKVAGAGESKINKFITRSIFGIIMMAGFAGLVWLGHLPITVFVMILQIMAFRELANVRYKAAKAAKVPRFRTVQWCWFVVALFYAYGKPLLLNILSGKDAQVLEHYHSWISFGLYWMLFIITVLSFRLDDLKYQMGQLTWTLVVIGLTVIQMKSLVMNIFNGLFWFVFPASLVICNDCCAYFCGLSLGKKIFKIPFLSLSPNKTWEGFIGAWLLTMAFAFWFPTVLTSPHLICPASRSADWDKCTPNSVFIYVDYRLPATIASLLGVATVQLMPIQLHGAFLGAFASLVAPFGGFFASAIKRAYRVKDFDNLIPGHGGVMDRMDCQFLMCLCTAVHYRTFIQVAAITVPVIIKYIERLSRPEQEEVLNYLQKVLASNP